MSAGRVRVWGNASARTQMHMRAGASVCACAGNKIWRRLEEMQTDVFEMVLKVNISFPGDFH